MFCAVPAITATLVLKCCRKDKGVVDSKSSGLGHFNITSNLLYAMSIHLRMAAELVQVLIENLYAKSAMVRFNRIRIKVIVNS